MQSMYQKNEYKHKVKKKFGMLHSRLVEVKLELVLF